MEGFNLSFDGDITILIFGVLIGLTIYAIYSIFLYNLHKLLYGKGNILVWIPFFGIQSYFLGKLAVNNVAGWILFAFFFIVPENNILGLNSTLFRSEAMKNTFNGLYSIAHIVLLVLAIIKYFKIKKQVSPGAANPNMVPNGTINQTDPFAAQNQIPNVPVNQYNPSPGVNPTPMSTNNNQPPTNNQPTQVNKFDPSVTIDSIIHHAPTTEPEAPIETLDMNSNPTENPAPVDTNNPNNM